MWVTPTAHDEILPENVRLISCTLHKSSGTACDHMNLLITPRIKF